MECEHDWHLLLPDMDNPFSIRAYCQTCGIGYAYDVGIKEPRLAAIARVRQLLATDPPKKARI